MTIHDENVLCAKCGYSLKGLPDRGLCPDCGNQFIVSLKKGIRVPAAVRTRMSGTPVIVGITTGMLSMMFCPCTGLLWMTYVQKTGRGYPASMPVIMTLIAVGLMLTCMVSLAMAAKEWWDVRKALQGLED